MKIEEVENVLLFASGLDHFVTVDRVTTDAWFRVLSVHEISFEQAMQACTDHYTGPDSTRQFTVAHIINSAAIANRATAQFIEIDVRSAKARGIVSTDWPDKQPLTAELYGRLELARTGDRLEAAKYAIDAEMAS